MIINPMFIKKDNEKLPVFCKIQWTPKPSSYKEQHAKNKKGKLSITGVIAPTKHGDAYGCGQIQEQVINPQIEIEYNEGWTAKLFKEFISVWNEWHLNDIQEGCEHQRSLGWEDIRINPKELPDSNASRDKNGILAIWVTQKEHRRGVLSKPCPVCGYKYGTEWKAKTVPQGVLNFLNNLPKTKTQPNWI